MHAHMNRKCKNAGSGGRTQGTLHGCAHRVGACDCADKGSAASAAKDHTDKGSGSYDPDVAISWRNYAHTNDFEDLWERGYARGNGQSWG